MSTKLSSSKDRFSFRRQKYLERKIAEGKDETNPDVSSMLDYMDNEARYCMQREVTPEWQKNNMEHDLRMSDWILAKVRSNDAYAQNLYAAMCNNDFQKTIFEDTPENVVEALKDGPIYWSCSWRHAGGIIADMQEKGDYIDWYCSGIRNYSDDEEINEDWDGRNYVPESAVTDEIRADLRKLGWKVIQEEDTYI